GTPFGVTVTARDVYNNVAATYRGTVHFTKTDSGAGSAVPADYTFVSGDNGAHTFTNGVTLVTAGSQTTTATDTVAATLTVNANVSVNAATANRLALVAPSSATAGTPFDVTVTAYDPYNNIAA